MQTFFIDYLEYLFFNNLNVYDKKTIFIMNSVIIALRTNIFMIKII